MTVPASPTTEPSPSPVPPPLRPARRWPLYLLGGVVALLLGLWLGDVPNRVRAGQSVRAAQIALLSSDFPGALRAFRQAALYRPGDYDVLRFYRDAQAQWLQTLDRQLDGLTPEDAYARLRALPPDTAQLFTEPQRSAYAERAERTTTAVRANVATALARVAQLSADAEFDQAYAALDALQPYAALAPELPERRRDVQIAQVRQALAAAEALAEREQYTGARLELEAVSALGALVPEHAERLAAIRAAELTQLLAEATTAATADEPDFPAARTALEAAAALNLEPERVDQIRKEIRDLAQAWFLDGLVEAIVGGESETVATALQRLAEHAGVATDVTPADLLEPGDLASYRAVLQKVGIGPGATPSAYRRDVGLLWRTRNRFADGAALQAFLADAFHASSRHLGAAKYSALALVIDQLARAEGAAEDPEWAGQMMTALRAKLPIAVAVRADEDDGDAFEGPAMRAAFRQTLRARNTRWPVVLADEAPAVDAILLELRGSVNLDEDVSTDAEERTVQYQQGTREVLNQERENTIIEHNNLLPELNRARYALVQAEQESADASNNPNLTYEQRVSTVTAAQFMIVQKSMQISRLERELEELRSQAETLPRTVWEPVYADEPYEVLTHRHTFEGRFEIAPHHEGTPLTEPYAWTAEAKRQTTEVVGDARRGVPVRAPAPIDRAALHKELTPKLARAVADVAGLWADLPEITLAMIARRVQEQPISTEEEFELVLGLGLLWQEAGEELANYAPVRETLLRQIGLK